MSLRKLVTSNLTTRKVRTALTLAAVAVSVSLIVAVTSGYKSAEGAIYKYLVQYLGATDAQITHRNDFRAGIPETLIDDLRKDPDVVRAFGRLETDTGMVDKDGKPVPGRAAQLIGIDRPIDEDATRTPTEQGAWFDVDRGEVAVIDQRAAEALGAKLGDAIFVPTATDKQKFTVVGICHKPGVLAERVSWIYLPLRTCQELTGRKGEVSRIMVRLKQGASAEAFAQRWEPRVAAVSQDLKIRLARDLRKELDKKLGGVHLLSVLGGAVSMIVAGFIIFTTLSMGVTERQRTLAMLRAIGATQGQVARLVVVEGGWLGALGALLGVPLGLFFAWFLTVWKHEFFSAGLIVDWAGIAMAVGGALVFSLVAGLLPAWSASRVSPLDAMTPHARPPSARMPLIAALVGLALVAIDPLMIRSGASNEVKYYGHFLVGLPGLVFGFFLLAPLFVWIVERAFGWVAARMMGVPPHLLRQQLSGGVWRSAGTGSALMVGLAILVVMQTVGNSMLGGWKLPDKFPDIFIFAGQGIPEEQWRKIEQVEGVRKGQVLPIAIAFPGLPDGIFGALGAALMPDSTMFLGVDPNLALDMMELDFRDGNKEDAKAGLLKGDHIIVTEEFRVMKGLKTGDKLALRTKTGMRDFTICGVVWSPGIDVMVSMFDMGRMFDQRTAASVFGSLDDAKKYFGKDKVFLFAANLDIGVDKAVVLKKVKEQVGEHGWKAGDVRKIKFEIVQGFQRLLMLLTTVAFSAMGVAAMGVTNTVMASVRSRQWQFGILRSIGVTRGQLVRVVLTEAILLGLVGCLLGLAAGFLMSSNALGLTRALFGYMTEMLIPWPRIGVGVAVIMGISLLASLWPAGSAARSEPLSLLQSGRAAV